MVRVTMPPYLATLLPMDDVAARGQVVEEPVDRPGPGPGLAVGTAAPGDVGFGEHGDRAPGRTKPRSTGATTMRAPGAARSSDPSGRSDADRYRQALLGQNARETLRPAAGG